MPWNGTGDISLSQNFIADRDAGLPSAYISAAKVDNVLSDLASCIEACINRNGENVVASDINWGTKRITNYGAATSATDVPRARQIAENAIQYGGTSGGSANAQTITNSFIATVATGTRILFVAGASNTAAATLNINGAGAVAIKRPDGSALSASDIRSGRVHEVVYDGTNWVLGFSTNPAAVVDSRTAQGDANYTILSSDRVLCTSAALTAARVWTCPAVSAAVTGQPLLVLDEYGGVTSSNTLTIAAAGSDTINGQASIVLATAYAGALLIPNGTSKWTCIPLATGSTDQIAYFAAANKILLATLSSFGRSLIDDADAAAVRVTLGSGATGDSLFAAASASSARSTLGFPSGFNLIAFPPQGRLTLQTVTPIMITTQSAKTVAYYTPYMGRFVPIFDGTQYVPTDIGGELSQATTDTTKSPAAVGNNFNYDYFVWSDSGTIRCTRGPAWSSDTARGSGAGTSELAAVNGVYLNANAITNGPGAQRGTYVGTVRSNGSAQIDWIVGAAAAGGTAAVLGVWNMYNRVAVETFVQDTTDSWNYTTATWRSANNSSAMRASFILGLAEDALRAEYIVSSRNSAAAGNNPGRVAGIGYDATNALATGCSAAFDDHAQGHSAAHAHVAHWSKSGDLGWHFAQALEWSTANSTTTWYGDSGGTQPTQNGLRFGGRF